MDQRSSRAPALSCVRTELHIIPLFTALTANSQTPNHAIAPKLELVLVCIPCFKSVQ